MYYCKILYYDNILKLGHKGQSSRPHSDIFDIPTVRQNLDVGEQCWFSSCFTLLKTNT